MIGLIIFVLASLSMCSGEILDLIPGDNSEYIEGITRYFWMPDGNGIPRLVDSQAPVDYVLLANMKESDNKYLLYTRDNPTTPQILINGDLDSVNSSNYLATRPLVVIVHGWRNNGTSPINELIKEAVLNITNYNVIVLDWGDVADTINYFTAAAGVSETGEYLGDFLVWLIDNAGGSWDNIHLVGHSLGAHVVGNAGRKTGGLPARITGLDPAGPTFTAVNGARLKKTDGVYVEVIHTDGNLLGIYNPLGHADFYPNGGTNPQPGCLVSTCSHGQSFRFFAASIVEDKFVGIQCANQRDAFTGKKCNGATFNMGTIDMNKRGSGIYYLKTGKEYPYYLE